MDFSKEFEMKKWKHDLEMYYKYKAMSESFKNELLLEQVKKYMEEIKLRWPNQQNCFE